MKDRDTIEILEQMREEIEDVPYMLEPIDIEMAKALDEAIEAIKELKVINEWRDYMMKFSERKIL